MAPYRQSELLREPTLKTPCLLLPLCLCPWCSLYILTQRLLLKSSTLLSCVGVRYNSPEPPRHYILDQKPNLSLHLFMGPQLPHRPNRRPGLQETPTWWANSSYPPDLRCLPWPPPRRRPASGPAGSFPSGRLHFCWCDVSKSPVSTLRTPDTEAETTGGGGEEGPGREGRRLGIWTPGTAVGPAPGRARDPAPADGVRGDGQDPGPGAHLAGARAAPRAAAAGGAGAQAGGGGEQAAVEGEHLAADEALQAAA